MVIPVFQRVHSGRILCCVSCVWRYDCRPCDPPPACLHTATGAVAHVTRELEAWQQEQQAAGHLTLADVPASVINGESVNLWHWRNAVYTATRALILERYRDADTTDKGDRRADALDNRHRICGVM
ncbi:Head completion/stabilization protein L [Escherichia coli]|uniref:Head completion/stabilization protein L n=1 Tax=Escherichia coli TaxID=562 RepID=A0A376ZEV8_ECOLX|nr:Head completion/stabilization protein L [Escherichia coli]